MSSFLRTVVALAVLMLVLGTFAAAGYAAESRGEPSQATLAERPQTVEDLLEALRRSDQQALADKIAKRIQETQALIQRYGGGHVIVGRVVLEGPEEQDPRLVNAQMEILPEGYFVGPVKDLVRPVGFRMHG